MKFFVPLLICALTAPAVQHTSGDTTAKTRLEAYAASGDPVFDAMKDEMRRSVEQLHLDKHDKPYYVSYRVEDAQTLYIDGSFGAITGNTMGHTRNLKTDVHVGSYNFDQGSSGGGMFSFAAPSTALPIDDNYDALRHKIWLATDSAYKHAVQRLEQKRADMQEINIKDRPDDWSQEKAEVEVQPKVAMHIDRNEWTDRIRKLSALFRNYPKIRYSRVTFYDSAANIYFVNSEGSQIRTGEPLCYVFAEATAEADDGEQIQDHMILTAVDPKHLPDQSKLESEIKDFAQRLSDATTGKLAEEYQGPVLFEGRAAAQFFQSALVPHLAAAREPESEGKVFLPTNPLQLRLGKRILPTFINVVDDPQLKDESGEPLAGYCFFDEQGVRAQKVELVDHGILKTLLCTRVPSMKLKNSNGHAYGSKGSVTNLVVKSTAGTDNAELLANLKELGKEEGLDYVYVAKDLRASMSGASLDLADFFGGGDKVKIPPPVALTRIYLSDGHEEPVRAAAFGPGTVRMLRDIVATGKDYHTYDFLQDYAKPWTVTCPSILVTDMEVQKAQRKLEKPPVLPHPYFGAGNSGNAGVANAAPPAKTQDATDKGASTKQ